MATVVRWSPLREMMTMRNAMDRLFNEALDVPGSRWNELNEWALALDLVENPDGFLVKASLPGIDPKDIEITLDDNVLTIRAEISKEELAEDARFHLRERRFGTFMRAVTLPVRVDHESIDASYDQGVLTLYVPKAEEVKPRRIAVKTNGHKVLEANNQ